MLCAGVVLPHPPLLVPEVAGAAAPELDGLRAACLQALTDGLATTPDRVVLVGADEPAGTPGGDRPSLAPYGVAGPSDGLPLSLTIGAWLLEEAGWQGVREFRHLPPGCAADAYAAIGADIAGDQDRVLLIALGDGSARRSPAAPGHLDPRAEGFDASVATALAAGDGADLLLLDPRLATELMAAGRGPWQVLAGAARVSGAQFESRLYYADAPYGVGYFVSCWRPAP